MVAQRQKERMLRTVLATQANGQDITLRSLLARLDLDPSVEINVLFELQPTGARQRLGSLLDLLAIDDGSKADLAAGIGCLEAGLMQAKREASRAKPRLIGRVKARLRRPTASVDTQSASMAALVMSALCLLLILAMGTSGPGKGLGGLATSGPFRQISLRADHFELPALPDALISPPGEFFDSSQGLP